MSSDAVFYTIALTNGIVTTSPNNGFVDNKLIRTYFNDFTVTPAGLTYSLSQAKRRGNLRFRTILQKINLITNMHLYDTEIVSNATGIAEATSFTFNIRLDQGDSPLRILDENNAGVYLTGAACLKRCIARAMTTTLTQNIDVYDPTSTTTFGLGITISSPRQHYRIEPLTMGPYATSIAQAETYITVTKLDILNIHA